jgi:hypothetical protein
MKIYFALITDYLGKPVQQLAYTATVKHSAFLAKEYIDHVPPACGFIICKRYIDAKEIAKLLNQGAYAILIVTVLYYS